MGEKSYLKNQVYLPGLSSTDLMTEEEYDAYIRIVEAGNELDRLDEQGTDDEEERRKWIAQKKKAKKELDELIEKSENKPRTVRLDKVIYYPKNANYPMPKGLTKNNLKFSKSISEFSSELTRAMGLKHMDFTFDEVIIHWKSEDIMQQIVMNGIILPILNPDGSVTQKHYHFFTASAGQLRTDRIKLVSDDMWEKIKAQMECGLSWDVINAKGGANCTKAMAYWALQCSATEPWEEFDIDRCIVIPEFKGKVTAEMMYIKSDYTYQNEVCTVEIDHTDGCGMMLPSVSETNFMIRGPGFKGLLCTFNYIEFCREKKVKPVIKDVWGKEWDLEKDKIQIVFCESMFKLWKYYDSWQQFKDEFRACKAHFGRTNFEEDEIDNTTLCYQMLNTLEDITDEEIEALTKDDFNRIVDVTKNKYTRLRVLKAKKDSPVPYRQALAYYPELLLDKYFNQQILDTRERMWKDARSGKLRMMNKRLFAIPDLYAACEFWFCHIENPEGLLHGDEVAAKPFRKYKKADVLRSPH